jgi:hypothetical protein
MNIFQEKFSKKYSNIAYPNINCFFAHQNVFFNSHIENHWYFWSYV